MRLSVLLTPSSLLLGGVLALTLQVPEQQQFIASGSDLSSVISKSPLLSLHRALVEIDSTSYDELAAGKFLVSTLEAHNFSVTTQQVDDVNNASAKRWNIYATPDTSKYPFSLRAQKHGTGTSQPRVLLTSHIDTVPPYIPYSLSRPHNSTKRGDIVIAGRGTVDDKACVAAQIMAALELLSDPGNPVSDPSSLALLFVVGEEVSGDGMVHFSNSPLYQDSLRASLKGIIFGEPTEGKLASGHKGISMAHIKATGKAAHSGYPWLGQSAISMILPSLVALDKLGDLPPSLGGLPRSDHFGNSTVNIGYLSGGVAGNVVPAHAEARIAFRLAGGTAASVRATILSAIQRADPTAAASLSVDIFQGYGPVTLDADVPGFPHPPVVVNYGTDVPNLDVPSHVKRYLYGPGSILVAHGDDEALSVAELERAVVDYKMLARHVLAL